MNSNDLPDPRLQAQEKEEPPPGLDLLGDCRLMLRFALKEALEIPEELRKDISQFDHLLISIGLPSLSNVPKALIGKQTVSVPGVVAAPQDSPTQTELVGSEGLDLLLRVHQGLSKVVAPATALSLQASEPQGRRRFLGGTPPIVKLAAVFATVSALTFVFSAPKIPPSTTPPATGAEKVKTSAPSPKSSATPTPAETPQPRTPEETPRP